MRAWVVNTWEPLPIKSEKKRLLRAGWVTNCLIDSGHEVIWWTSNFDHFDKRHRYPNQACIKERDNLEIRLIKSKGYRKNVSLNRIFDHQTLARRLDHQINKALKPDIIFCSYPPILTSVVATSYGKKYGVPVILDIRDLWPHSFLNLVPAWQKWIVQMAIFAGEQYTKRSFKNCSGIVGISDNYLNWGLQHAGRSRRETDEVFPLGYQKECFTDEQVRKAKMKLAAHGIKTSKIICWYVGSFGWSCDLGTVIEAAKILKKRGEDRIQFVFSGDGYHAQAWKAKAIGLKNVIFTGWINGVELAYMLNIADIGLQAYAPGVAQGLTNKLFEYLSGGIPILSSLEGESAEFLHDERCGLTYQAGDSRDLVDRLLLMTERPQVMREMGANASRIFHERYEARRISEKIVAHLERVRDQSASEQQFRQNDVFCLSP